MCLDCGFLVPHQSGPRILSEPELEEVRVQVLVGGMPVKDLDELSGVLECNPIRYVWRELE